MVVRAATAEIELEAAHGVARAAEGGGARGAAEVVAAESGRSGGTRRRVDGGVRRRKWAEEIGDGGGARPRPAVDRPSQVGSVATRARSDPIGSDRFFKKNQRKQLQTIKKS